MDILVSVVLPLGLAFIMFSLGVGLTPADFLRVGQRPLAFLVGALHQVILLPIVVYILILIFGFSGELAVGMMILAACPGGVTSNVVAKLARGDVALSVSLTAIISLASVITVPLILTFAVSTFMGADAPDVDITTTAVTMFLITVVPILIGLTLRSLVPAKMIAAEPLLAKIATTLFVIIILAAVGANWDTFTENLALLGPALILLVIILTTIGFLVPRLLGRTKNEAKTISIETGIQNGTLGIAIAGILVGASDSFATYAIPSAIYGPIMYLTLLPALFIYRNMD